jgi:EAL domain-containing protein (putative c-di-GMP-specific phosphodiesterase class I)
VAIVGIAHTLGIRVVAEGIETAEQAELLRQWGCEEGQGYLYSKPLAPADFARYVSHAAAVPA